MVLRSGACCAGILIIACNGEAEPRAFRVRDSAGITIVENDHRQPAWGEGGWRLTREPIIQIGSVSSDGPDQLFGVMHSQLLPTGEILIVNSRAQDVRIFDEHGQHRRTIGRRGDGPGEFRSPWQAYPLPGDSLLVIDLYRAVSVFDAQGNYVRRFVPGDTGGERQGAPVGQFADGSLLFRRHQRQDPAWIGVRRSQVELVRFDLSGTLATSFGLFDDQTVRYGGGPQYLFGAWAQSAPLANSIIHGPGDRFELREVATDGRTVRLIRLDLPRRPVTEDDKDAFLESVRERMREQGQLAFFERIYADADAPEHFPAHFDIRVDDSGRIWVQDYRPLSARVERTWYVFDEEGIYLGSVVFPAGFTVHQIARDKVIGRWTDDDDVEYVRVYGIESRTQ